MTLREKGALAVDVDDTEPRSALSVVVSGVLSTLSIRSTLFVFAFLPQFVSTDEPHVLLRILQLSAVFMLLTLVVFAAYGVLAASVRKHVISRPQVMTWMRRVLAGSFLALGAKLALTEK